MITRYGNTNFKRLKYINGFDPELIKDPASQIGFIKEKGLFMEYVLKNYNEGLVTIHCKGKKEQATRCNDPAYYFDKRWQTMQEIEYEGKKYYVGLHRGFQEYYEVYAEADRIMNDDDFHWKVNNKFGTRETTLTNHMLEYFCIVDQNNRATIDIRYTACNNKHRSKVTMATIEIFNASNEEILDAINEWKAEFKKNL